MSYNFPGVYIQDTATNVNTALVTPSSVVMYGTAISGSEVATVNTRVAIDSLADFTTKFGSDSDSYPYVAQFFNQVSRSLEFVNVATVGTVTVTEVETALSATVLDTDDMVITIASEFADLGVPLANALIAHAELTDNFTIVDVDVAASTDNALAVTYVGTVTASPNAAIYFPYVIDSDDNSLAPSATMAGVYMKVYQTIGIQKSPAGVKHKFKGVTGLTFNVDTTQGGNLNDAKVNCIISKPRLGVYAYGCRTLQTEVRFINTSIILLTQKRSLRDSFEAMLFETIDSKADLYQRAKTLANSVLGLQWLSNQLAGDNPRDAFQVICDDSNNPAESLSLGRLNLDIYQKPAGSVEVVVIVPHAVDIGTVNEALLNR